MTLRKIAIISADHTNVHGECEVHVSTVYRDTGWNEFRVTFSVGGVKLPSATYHTQDKQDAMSTAHMMAHR